MNYYPHHIGDYASATAHLSMLEDCAYRRLLDWYYLDEKPIPVDPRTVYRRVRASSEAEREAVDVVLGEFFDLTDEGYRHARCDAEIERSRSKSDARRSAANSSWNSRRMSVASTLQSKLDANASAAHANASGEDAFAMHTQEPIANSQEPKKKQPRVARWANRPPDVSEGAWSGFVAIRKARRSPITDDTLADFRREGDKAGLSLDAVLAICNRRGWQGFDAGWLRANPGHGARASPADAKEVGRAAAAASIYGAGQPLDLTHGTRDQEPFTIDV